MSSTILLALSLTIWSPFGQLFNPDYSSEKTDFFQIDNSHYQFNQATDTLVSPDKKYKIIVDIKDAGDNVSQFEYRLIRVQEEDTTKLMSCSRHDLPPANFFWTSTNSLVYDESDYGQDSQIHIWDLAENKIIFSSSGLLPIRKQWRENFYDQENEIVFFYKITPKENEIATKLMCLDVKKKEVKELLEIQTMEYEYPLVTFDAKDRSLTIKHWDFKSDPMKVIPIENDLNY